MTEAKTITTRSRAFKLQFRFNDRVGRTQGGVQEKVFWRGFGIHSGLITLKTFGRGFHVSRCFNEIWCEHREALRRQGEVVRALGFEPRTFRVSVECSTN